MLNIKSAILANAGATTIVGGSAGVYYLSQDKTIEHKLNREGIDLISTNDEYEVAFIERKSNKDFRETIDNADENSLAAVGGKKLETWCKDNLKKDLSEDNIKNIYPKAKNYCSKPSLTIEERYTKLKKELIEGEGKWSEKYGQIKGSSPTNKELADDLKEEGLTDGNNQDTAGGVALQKWCNKNIKTPLAQDKEEKIWKKVEGRCFKT